MSSDVLVLNKSFCAVQITSWQRALTLLYNDHARVVDEEYKMYSFEGWRDLSSMIQSSPSGFVHTPHFKIAIPEVIALRFYDQLPAMEVKFTRRNIYEHYHYMCCYCGRKLTTSDLNLEHVIPRSRGGHTDWNNIVISCITCNLRKANRTPEEARMKLLVRPTKPRWRGATSLLLQSPIKIKAAWQRFIDYAYWNTELEKE